MVQSPTSRPGHDLLRLVARKYALHVIALLDTNGPMRYTEIEAALAAPSSSTLASLLEDLTDAGLVERHWYDEIPPRVEYALTARGRELTTRLEPLLEWTSDAQ